MIGWMKSKKNIGVTEYIKDEGEEILAEEFTPSENIEDAWEVKEKLKDMGYGVQIYMEKGFEPHVTLWTALEGEGEEIQGETEALALCRAALMAVGQEVPE